jgi:hypothetical protein
MNTALISFIGGNNYTKEKQIRQILREENEQWGISCKDYDELEVLMPILHENKIKKVIILHEDKNLDRAEAVIKQEFNHLFEKIEVLPEGFIRLYEADGGTAAQPGGAVAAATQGGAIRVQGNQLQQAQQNNENAFSSIIVYGPNPLLKGTKDLGIKDTNGTLIISILSLQCSQTGLWNFSAPVNASIKKMTEIKNFAYGRTIEGVLGAFGLNANNLTVQQIQVFTGKNTQPQWLTHDQKITSLLQMNNETFDQQAAMASYKIGTEILSGKAKPDQNKIADWEEKRLPLMGFLIKQLGDIQHSMTIGDKDEANKDGHSLVNSVLEKFGVYKDVATAAKNLRTGGASLLVDAAEIISKELGKNKTERKEKKSDALVSHPKFEEFAQFFCDDIDQSNSQFVEK